MPLYTFHQGRYYLAGIDKPLVVPTSTIVEAVNDMGFRVISYGEAEEAGCGRSPTFTPPGRCGEDWDWMGLALRTGPTKTIEVPDRVWWIYEYQPMTPAPPPGPGVPPPPATPPQQGWVNPQPSTPTVEPPSTAAVGKAVKSAAASTYALLVGGAIGLGMAWWYRRR